MAVIESGATSDLLTVHPTSKAARTMLYDASGNPVGLSAGAPIYVNSSYSEVVPGWVGTYCAASFRIVGTVATAHPLMTIRNNAGSYGIAVRRIAVDINYSAAAVFLTQAYFRLWENTGVTPSGGSAPTKHKMRSSYPTSQAATEILFAASADGTAAAITHATPAASPAREQGHGNILTAAGAAFNVNDYELINYAQHPLYVLNGETAALILILSANNIATQHYTVKIIWEEFAP